jgi:2-aminoadipate transaminase
MIPPTNQFPIQYASWVNSIKTSVMQKMLIASCKPNFISFALGLPDPKLFPIENYQTAVQKVLTSNSKALQYEPPPPSLKQKIVELMKLRGVKCQESQIFLTAGSQQAISLLSRLLLEPEDKVITESITYPGFLQIITPFTPEIVGIPLDLKNGLCLDTLESMLNHHKKPSLIYSMPTGHNPLGINFTEKQKLHLGELSCTYKVPTIEDDAYGLLYYDQQTTALRGYESEWVFYVGTFSKIIAPSFRVGWLIVPEELVTKLAFIKESSDINTATFAQHIIDEMLNDESFLPNHLGNLRQIYKERRDVMIKSIQQYFPQEIKISKPTHGFFIWVELAKNINTFDLFHKALAENIAFMPGEIFSCNSNSITTNALRLNFSNCTANQIEMGIMKLGAIIKSEFSKKQNQNQPHFIAN